MNPEEQQQLGLLVPQLGLPQSPPPNAFGLPPLQQPGPPNYLPVQTAMPPGALPPQAPQVQALSGIAPAPMSAPQSMASSGGPMPPWQLSDLLKQGPGNPPQIPSGQPTADQQQQANLHQSIGSDVAAGQAGLAQLMNVYRPGSGGLGPAQLSLERGNQLAQQILQQPQQQRQEALQNAKLLQDWQAKQAMDSQERAKAANALDEVRQRQAMASPKGDLAESYQKQYVNDLNDALAYTQNPALKAEIKRQSQLANLYSPDQINGARQNGFLRDILKLESAQRAAALKESAKGGNGSNPLTKQEQSEDNKALTDIGQMNQALNYVNKSLSDIDAGKLNYDWTHRNAQPLLKAGEQIKAGPGIDVPLQQFKTEYQPLLRQIEHAASHSSRYTKDAWNQLIPDEGNWIPGSGDSTQSLKAKLQGMQSFLENSQAERASLLHGDYGDKATVDTSHLGKTMQNGPIDKTTQQLVQGTQPGTKSPSVQPAADPLIAKAKAAIASPGATAAQKKNAQKYLDDHGGQ